MDQSTADVVKTFGGVALGWLLGIGSSAWDDWRKARKKRVEMRRAIAVEMNDLRDRLFGVIFSTEKKFGTLNRAVIAWLLPLVQKYTGPTTQGIVGALNALQNLSEIELEQHLANQQQQAIPSLFYPQMEAPYTAIALSEAGGFEPDYTGRILDIVAHLRIFRDTRENYIYYQRLTFEPGVIDENHEKAVANAEQSSQLLSQRARILVEKIIALGENCPPVGGFLTR